MKLDKVIDGATKYISAKLYPTMVDWQKLIAVDVVSRLVDRADTLATNSTIRALGYIDGSGDVDIENVLRRIKSYIGENGGRWKIKLPLMPTFTFTEDDVDELYEFICKGE